MANPQGSVDLNQALDDAAAVKVPARDDSAAQPTPLGDVEAIGTGDEDLGLDPNDPLVKQLYDAFQDRETQSGHALRGKVPMTDDAASDVQVGEGGGAAQTSVQPPTTPPPSPDDSDERPSDVPPGIPSDAIPPVFDASGGEGGGAAPDVTGGTAGAAPLPNEPTVRVGDRDIPVSHIPSLLSSHDVLMTLTEDQARAINDILEGRAVPIPVDQYGNPLMPAYPSAPSYAQQAPVAPPGPAPLPGSGGAPVINGNPQFAPQPVDGQQQVDFAALNELDPQLASAIYQQQQQLAAAQQQLNALAQQQMQQQQATINAALSTASERVASKYALSPIELDHLARVTTEMQLVAWARNQTPDAAAAIELAMDTAYHADPRFREREVRRATTNTPDEDAELQARKRRASGIAVAGAQVSRTPPPQRPLNERERMESMARMIAEDMQAQNEG